MSQFASNITSDDRPTLSPELFEKFRAFIYDKTGIYFQNNKRYLLENRSFPRLQSLNLNSYSEYLNYLAGRDRSELQLLINAITINETFFFRSPEQFTLIDQKLLPELVSLREKDGTKRIRLWSSACSTGDEPYSIALMVEDRWQPRYPHIQFEVHGSDIDSNVINAARAGNYSEYAIRNIPADMMRKYFQKEDNRYLLDEKIKDRVAFKTMSLIDANAQYRMKHFDIIFCTNVLIYFDTKSKKTALDELYESLNPNAYLLIGYSETLFGIEHQFETCRFDKLFAFKR